MTTQPHSPDTPPLLAVRFIGESLDKRAIPIYELSQTLVAIQRIINKTYFFNQRGIEGLQKNSNLPPDIRQIISLQMSGHHRGSDIYEFNPFVHDEQAIQLLTQIVGNAIEAIGFYAHQRTITNGNRLINSEGKFIEQWNSLAGKRILKDLILSTFNKAELEDLCLALEIDYEDLDEGGKRKKVLELIGYMQRRGRVLDLIKQCKQLRPLAEWPSIDDILEQNKVENYEKDSDIRMLAGAIYKEILDLNRRIDNIGDVASIEIFSPLLSRNTAYVFTGTNKDILTQIIQEPIYGKETTIEGTIITLYLTTSSAELIEASGNKLRISFPEKDFEKIRQNPEQNPRVRIKGIPKHRLGLEHLNYYEIEAGSFSFLAKY